MYTALQVLIHGNWSTLLKALNGISRVISYCVPYLLKLIIKSIVFLWPPILSYIIIGIITTSRWWRFYLCLCMLAVSILILNHFVFAKMDFSIETLKEIPTIFMYIIQIYILLLWTFPREIWNFIGGILFAIYSLMITIMPDLPTYFDDLGMIFAVFAFIFLYINTIASITQRFIDRRVILQSREIINKAFNGLTKKLKS